MSSSHSSSEYVTKQNKSRISKQYFLCHIYYSIVYNNQETEMI